MTVVMKGEFAVTCRHVISVFGYNVSVGCIMDKDQN
jgi:hypothetical protein